MINVSVVGRVLFKLGKIFEIGGKYLKHPSSQLFFFPLFKFKLLTVLEVNFL